jgi:hypothetical protein
LLKSLLTSQSKEKSLTRLILSLSAPSEEQGRELIEAQKLFYKGDNL